MARSRKTLVVVAALASTLALMCGGISPSVPVSAGGALAVRLALQVRPDHVALGGQFTVLLSGARPGQQIAFTMQPAFPTTGFGGGLMGRFRADHHGVIRFLYPAGRYRWELGPWRVTAGPLGGGSAARTTVTFVPAGRAPVLSGAARVGPAPDGATPG